MQIDFNQQIYNLNGTEAMTGGQRCQVCGSLIGGEPEPLMLKIVASRALIQPDNQTREQMDKAERALLALQIFDAEEPLDLDSEKVAQIKGYINAMWPPVTVAQTNELLEGRPNPFKREE